MTMRGAGPALALVAAAFFSGDAAARPYTVTDHLKLAILGDGATDPTGRWMVWHQTPSYEQLADYGIPRFHAVEGGGYRLMAVDLSAAVPAAAPLFAADPLSSYWLDSFSPDGRFVLFYAAKAGELTMGAYDFKLGKVVSFAAAPAVKLRGGHRSVWLSAEEFVFSALPQGVQPAVIGLRRYTGQQLWAQWRKAWQGTEPSVSEVNSRASGESDDFLPGRLLRANARTGALETMADGLYENLVASADGRFLAALRQLPRVQPKPGSLDVDWMLTRSQLVVFDLRARGEGRRVAPDKDVFPVTLAWAPDTNRLAFFAWEKGAGARQGIFYSLQAESGAITPYPHNGLALVSERERASAEKPERAVWIDGKLAVFARELGDPRAAPNFTYTTENRFRALKATKPDWFLLSPGGRHEKLTAAFKVISSVPLHADAHSLTVLADGAVWRLAAGRAPRNLTAGAPGSWAHTSAVLYSSEHRPFSSFVDLEETGGTRFALLDLRTGAVSVVISSDADTMFVAGSPRHRTALFRRLKDAVTHLVLRDADGRERTVETLNAHLAEVAPMEWLHLKYTAQTHLGSRELESCALLPPDYRPGRRYPLIVEVYPNLGASCVNPRLRKSDALGVSPAPINPLLFAARDYILLRPSTPSALIRTPDGPLSGMTAVALAGADALAAQGYADPKRLGLFGFSQGGFSALWVATRTSRFNAVVSVNGWSDLYSQYFEGTIYQKFYAREVPYTGNANTYEIEGGDFGLGVSPYDNPQIYLRNSALFNAPKITSPLLLMHSDMDAFNLAQYEMMFTALYRQRKEVKFLRYWGEGHGVSSPANVRHSNSEMFAWYDRWLDVARADDGSVVWEGEYPASRQGAPARTAQWFIENDRRIAVMPSASPAAEAAAAPATPSTRQSMH